MQDSKWKTTYITQKHIIKEHIIFQPKHQKSVNIIKSRNWLFSKTTYAKECFLRSISHLFYSSWSESIAILAGFSFNMDSTGLSTQRMITCFTAIISFLHWLVYLLPFEYNFWRETASIHSRYSLEHCLCLHLLWLHIKHGIGL